MRIRLYRRHRSASISIEWDGTHLSFPLEDVDNTAGWTMPPEKLAGFEHEMDVDGAKVMQALGRVLNELYGVDK